MATVAETVGEACFKRGRPMTESNPYLPGSRSYHHFIRGYVAAEVKANEKVIGARP